MFPAVRAVRSDLEGDAVAFEPQAGRVCDPQQRSHDAGAPVELSRVAHVAGHVDRVVPRGGEIRRDVAGRAGRLAPRALGRAPRAARLAVAAVVIARTSPALERAQPTRQDAASATRRRYTLRHHRSAETARLLRYRVPGRPVLEERVPGAEPAPLGERDATEVVAMLGERAEFRDGFV